MRREHITKHQKKDSMTWTCPSSLPAKRSKCGVWHISWWQQCSGTQKVSKCRFSTSRTNCRYCLLLWNAQQTEGSCAMEEPSLIAQWNHSALCSKTMPPTPYHKNKPRVDLKVCLGIVATFSWQSWSDPFQWPSCLTPQNTLSQQKVWWRWRLDPRQESFVAKSWRRFLQEGHLLSHASLEKMLRF